MHIPVGLWTNSDLSTCMNLSSPTETTDCEQGEQFLPNTSSKNKLQITVLFTVQSLKTAISDHITFSAQVHF